MKVPQSQVNDELDGMWKEAAVA